MSALRVTEPVAQPPSAMVRSARKLAMTSMLGVLCQYAIHEKCTPKTFSERLFFNPATMPMCTSLGRFADSYMGAADLGHAGQVAADSAQQRGLTRCNTYLRHHTLARQLGGGYTPS